MAVDSVASSLAPQISGAIQKAARSTGISFNYLLTTAKIESNLNPSAQASTSSAKGLYQFIEQTWLGTVKQAGEALGLGQYVESITQGSDGRYEVADPAARAEIMKLRGDPDTSAMMAGALARSNAEQLGSAIGRAPSEGELYAAHFLGPNGAARLINTAMTNTRANAASMFPAAAAANRNIFYHRDGSPRTAGEVYGKLTSRFDSARTVAVATNAPSVSSASLSPAAAAAAALAPPDTAGVTQAFAAAHDRLPPLPDTKPLFQAMFTDRARAAVTKTVASLWTPGASAPSLTSSAADASAAAQQARPLDLFTDSATNVRGLFHGRG